MASRSASIRTTAVVIGVCDSPGSSTTTSLKPAPCTSALNACASVSIGGNVL